MEHTLALGSVIPAALGAGCCAATGRRPWAVIAAMAAMVLAMVDTMLWGERLLPAYAWGLLLAAAAVTLLVTQRRHALGRERAAHVALMALLTHTMGIAHGPAAQATHAQHAHHGHAAASASGADAPHAVVLAIALVAVAWSVVMLRRAITCVDAREHQGLLCAERVLGAVSLIAMSAMVVMM